MAEKNVSIWYDPEADYLEVTFDKKPGYFHETPNDAVMQKVDNAGNAIGFSVLGVSTFRREEPLALSLGSSLS
ncbi:hypothetical protein BH23GEM7_BH23GEM7_27340 [soil metagenome]